MSINKCLFDFHLTNGGWISTTPYEEDDKIADPPGDRILTIRMVEFGDDDKPDIWYKAEIAYVGSNKQIARELINKYGLPKGILVNCATQKEELEKELEKTLGKPSH